MMRAGPMRHQIQLQLRSTVQDAAGEPSNVWTLFSMQRASVERSPGKEIWASAQRNGRVPTLFRIRYLANVTTDMRLVHLCCGSKVHNILSAVDQEGRKEELLLTTEELSGETP